MNPVNAIDSRHIDACIVETEYVVVKGHAIYCVLTLVNGSTVSGKSLLVDPALFTNDVGKALALESARQRVWEREQYVARSRQMNKINFTDQYTMKQLLNEAYYCMVEGDLDKAKALVRNVAGQLKGQDWRETRFNKDDMIAAQQKMQG